MRQLALHFDINPMTISKAYSILEMNRVVERRRGKGMIIAKQHKVQKDLSQRLQILRPDLDKIIQKAQQLAIPGKDLKKMIIKILEETK